MVDLPLSELADAFITLEELALKEACEQSLMEFTAYLWDIADPGEELVGGWAMEAICLHLEACYYGHIKRLLVTVPPGFSKSSLCNVFFPLWVWIKEQGPHKRFIHASYEQGIPERDNLKCRNILSHEKFRKFWGDKFQLTVPNKVDRFENNHTGWKMATAVGAKLIGHRGNYIIIDDPNDPSVENLSGAKRVGANRWFRETVPTRLNKASRDVIIAIQQRLHMEDVAGVALSLEHESYVHLNIPMEYEPRLYINAYTDKDDEDDPNDADPIVTLFDRDAEQAIAADPDCIFWQDPRARGAPTMRMIELIAPQVENELAWPERFTKKDVRKMKLTLGPTAASAQLQQRPIRRGGNIIKESDWKTWTSEKFPPFDFILATLDTAFTEDEANDPSGLCVWGLFHENVMEGVTLTDRMGHDVPKPRVVDQYHGNPRIMLIYAWTDWIEFNDLVLMTLHTCTQNKINYGPLCEGHPRFPVDTLVIEGKANGISVQQELVRLVSQGKGRNLFVDLLPAKMLRDDKESRLNSVSHLWRNGVIYAPDKDYANEVIDQVCGFPYKTHDEYADCASMAMRWFRDRGFAPTREEIHEEEEAAVQYRAPPKPLYGGIG